jgi:hypothetical protein
MFDDMPDPRVFHSQDFVGGQIMHVPSLSSAEDLAYLNEPAGTENDEAGPTP